MEFVAALKNSNWTLAAAAAAATGATVLLAAYQRPKRNNLKVKNIATEPAFEVTFVLGGPGAGKGTQCALITENYGLCHLSAGDLLREERNSGSKLADMINSYIKEGKIVPAEVTIRLLKQAMEKSGKTKFLIDGFPRNVENLSEWLRLTAGYASIQAVLVLQAPEEVMMARLLERGRTSGRLDDNVESIKKRFRTYTEDTRQVIDFFQQQGRVVEVEATRTREEVFTDVKRLFEWHVVHVLGGPGSGKGTNCARVVEELGYEHLSAGDLLRAERSSGSELAEMINSYIAEGKIVPAEVTIRLLKQAMARSHRRRFLIDGFPRNLENYNAWKQVMGGLIKIQCLLYLECPEDVMEARLLARQRGDDNINTIRKRFQSLLIDTAPVVKDFETLGLVRRVDAGREIDAVYSDVREILKKEEQPLV